MRTFVINRMYAGSYLSDNMGGEYLNLLHDDYGNNYIFINPYGFIDKKYDDTVEAVILTRLVNEGCFEILGIALTDKGSQITYQKGYSRKERIENSKIEIEKYSKENDIRYGGYTLKEINLGSFFGADITFKSKCLWLPKNEIYIADSHHKDCCDSNCNTKFLEDKRFSKQSLHCYVTDEDNKESFKTIEELINNDSLWIKDKINKVEDNRIIDKNYNFLDIIRKEYDELAYSNLFSYIFKTYPEAFKEFANKVLGVEIKEPYFIQREKANIDIWIEDFDNVIVIENKIKSGINGVSPRHDFSKGGPVESQLLKYFKYVKEEKPNKKAHFFLFVPNYNKIKLDVYQEGQRYIEIKYSRIYDFFSKIDIKDQYYKEFIKALYKHTKDREVDYAEDTNIRFLERLGKIKK